jgi:hypothetical protein
MTQHRSPRAAEREFDQIRDRIRFGITELLDAADEHPELASRLSADDLEAVRARATDPGEGSPGLSAIRAMLALKDCR